MRHALPSLVVAPNGARRGKTDHPELPITTDELVATALACQKVGAGGIHLHVRDDDGLHSLDTGRYREALAALGQATPDLFVQVTSEAAGVYGPDAQREMVRELRPASVSVALREMLRTPEDIDGAAAFYAWALEAEVGIQHIVYTPGELNWFLECVDQGIVPGLHHQLQFVLGSYAGTEPSNPTDLEAFLAPLHARKQDMTFDWMVCAFGAEETPCLAYAATRGGKARVGFENSLWNADGSLARDNAERVSEVRAAIDAATQTLSPPDR